MSEPAASGPVTVAEQGDLRPAFNSQAASLWRASDQDAKEIESALINRFLQLARPIADSSQSASPENRLQDAGHFFYLVHSLRLLGSRRIEETLLMILDEFLRLDTRSYDELYLWSIVELSRVDAGHIETFWPMVLALDVRYRPGPWQRPPEAGIADLPYQLTELLFYYYVLHTLRREADFARPYRSLAKCLQRISSFLGEDQRKLLGQVLANLASSEKRVDFGDAYGLLMKPKGTIGPARS